MWQVEKPEIFQCRNGEKTWVALIPVRAGESLNVGKCDTVWDIDGGEEMIDEADQKAIYDEQEEEGGGYVFYPRWDKPPVPGRNI